MPPVPLFQEIIRRKRDRMQLTTTEIVTLIGGVTDGSLADAQVGAFAMAALLNGMDREETVALTAAMARSGEELSWAGLGRPVIDKHSTGGVGDGTSLLLAPIGASLGLAVPMISGRGLGHTGGTLDKLDAIPGYRSQPDLALFRRVVAEVGCAIVGQTSDLAPADRRLYAVRDVTATVESIPLITASILSKKLAAGLEALVLDVKTGSGAFMASLDDARALATSLVEVAAGAGLKAQALITDMDAPLGSAAGNALEVRHAIEHLTGRRAEPRFLAVTTALAGAMAEAAGEPREAARSRIAASIASGSAAETFARMVRALGGPADLVERPDSHLAAAPVVLPVMAERAGHVAGVDGRALGLVVVALGGGRRRPEDVVDPAVGLAEMAAPGDEVGPGGDARPLALVHARSREAAQAAAAAVRAAYRIGEAPAPRPPVLERIGA